MEFHVAPRLGGSLLRVLLMGAAVAFSGAALASPQSQALVDQGIVHLKGENWQAAMAKFDDAANADPNDLNAVFFQGVGLNRLMRHREALAKLEAVAKRNAKRAGLDFEMGWALLGVHRYDEAVKWLEAYEKTHPGVGKTSELLGRAEMGLGHFNQANVMLKEAAQRSPRLAPNVELQLAILEQFRRNRAASRRHVERLRDEYPNSPAARVLSLTLRRPQAEEPEKPWHLTLWLGTGYNSNVLAVGDSGLPGGAPLPAGIRRDGSTFATMGLTASYDLVRTEQDTLTAGYTLHSNLHGEDDTHPGDLLGNSWFIDWKHQLGEDVVARLLIVKDYFRVGHRPYSHEVMVRPSITCRLNECVTIEGAYAYQNREYIQTPPRLQVQDRDANDHTLGLTAHLACPVTEFRTRTGYYHTWSRADGRDFDFDADALFVFISHPLPCNFDAEVGWQRIWGDYHERNSVAGPFGFAFSREDNINVISVELTRPLGKRVTLFLRYQGILHDSNIPEYDFNQHVYTGGVLVEF